MADIAATVETYWATAQARDWRAFGATLADDVRYELPQTRERVLGRDGVVRFNAEYLGEWSLEVERVIADGEQAVSWVRFSEDEEETQAISFFTASADGRIQTITDFWPAPYEPPREREQMVERF
ncbi:nuclear transport factor 2 family protein [Streptomyces violaceusniger]|uniref:SnoaL-like domain-containing protein n=1 Tax=Streptomyces melanosporofaciens TaxID=67327 RepID=A0A1H4QEV4_STRMJ|nr:MULTISPECIES: nuclear transport factor 2 family protein [Streptomyces]MBO3673963.1 nuclear transport factor 2 family protein [Streptomyces sp. NEAU-YJ-81]SEC18139.1 SnoaL-like domain-containing protein [Streptomyces melanosporofaciens]